MIPYIINTPDPARSMDAYGGQTLRERYHDGPAGALTLGDTVWVDFEEPDYDEEIQFFLSRDEEAESYYIDAKHLTPADEWGVRKTGSDFLDQILTEGRQAGELAALRSAQAVIEQEIANRLKAS